jgi:hypothetical protein
MIEEMERNKTRKKTGILTVNAVHMPTKKITGSVFEIHIQTNRSLASSICNEIHRTHGVRHELKAHRAKTKTYGLYMGSATGRMRRVCLEWIIYDNSH